MIAGRALIAGAAAGPILRLALPLGFWGGVDAATGRIVDARHPDRGASIAGTVLAIPATIGSSSSSSVMLELIRNGRAPAALVLGAVDPILVLGIVVAGELGYRMLPVLALPPEHLATLPQGAPARVADGTITIGQA